jgi:hypothetical protein
MSQSTQNKLSSKVLEKTLTASIKKEIAAIGINTSTRQGNKELKFLTRKIAKYPFDNIEPTFRRFNLYIVLLKFLLSTYSM